MLEKINFVRIFIVSLEYLGLIEKIRQNATAVDSELFINESTMVCYTLLSCRKPPSPIPPETSSHFILESTILHRGHWGQQCLSCSIDHC